MESVGAPHIRQRLYWVAYRSGSGLEIEREQPTRAERAATERGGEVGWMALADRREREWISEHGGHVIDGQTPGRVQRDCQFTRDCEAGGLPDTERDGLNGRGQAGASGWAEPANGGGGDGPWSDVVYIPCADGKARPLPRATESTPVGMATRFPPLVVRGSDQGAQDAENSAEARVMRLRGYGNAINIGVAVTFIRAFMDILDDIGA